jgi:hypothetical protein
MKNLHIIPTKKPSRLYLDRGKLWIDNLVYGSNNQHIYITNDEKIKEGDWFIESLGLPDSYLVHKLSKEWKDKESFYRRCAKVILTTDQDLIDDGVQSIDNKFLKWFVKNPSCEFVKVSELRFFNPDTNESAHCKWEYDLPQEEPKQGYSKSETKILGIQFTLKDGTKQFVSKQETLKETDELFDEAKSKFGKTLEILSDFSTEETLEEAAKNWGDKFYGEYDDIREYMASAFVKGAKWQAERMYSEEEVIELLTARCKHFGTTMTPFRELLLKQDLEWFEENKKK